jgi:hypothetical protein
MVRARTIAIAVGVLAGLLPGGATALADVCDPGGAPGARRRPADAADAPGHGGERRRRRRRRRARRPGRNIITDYLSLTNATAKSRADGESVIDKGEVANLSRCGNSRVAIACSFQQPGQVVGPYRETDQRYDDDYSFTNDGAVAGSYDCWHIAAHESGHGIGLDRSTASRWSTMYPQALQASTSWRTLAAGDIAGMRNIYP